jgi:hypothetical protein
MTDLTELRSAAKTLRQWVNEIRADSVPAPYAAAGQDIALLERCASLLEDAADEIARLRSALPSK